MGEFFALACALAWAVAVILFRKAGLSVPPLALNLFRVTVSSGLFLLTLAATGHPLLHVAPLGDYLILAASGVVAIALSDTLFHMSLNRVGAGVNAVVDSLYSPFVVLFAFLMLSERLGPQELAGMVLIVSAVILSTQVRPPQGTNRRELVTGVVIGVAAMASLAFGIVLAKPVIERNDVVWSTTVRQLGALAALAPAALIAPGRRRTWSVFRPRAVWRVSLPGTVMGSYLALLLWIGGMKYTEAGIASILNQTSTIYILILATVVLHEPFTRRKTIAAVMAVAGAVLVLGPGF
ncbi:EamA family transporter [bacterium CG_4_9_14_3_um_filter_65_15]|nr:MAG: EamA family transporter [bacterium CG_4_9_14_3_um_filter_65_15]